MHRAVTALAIGSICALAACGGGSSKQGQAPAAKQTPNGGVVAAVPSKGRLGPAIQADPSGTHVVGPAAPLSPKENRPTDAQANGVAGAGACSRTAASPAASNLGALHATILCLLNAERASHGLAPLHSNGSLGKAAASWASAMVARRIFAHESGSSSPLSRIRRTGYVHGNWQIGENIAWGSGTLSTPRSIVNGWMHSPGHRANILHGAFRDIGIGIKLGAPGPGLNGGATYVTDFGKHS